MTVSTWVTPTLFVGVEPSRTNVQPQACSDAEQAINVIRGGGTAWFPTDEWDDLVRETMRGLDAREHWIERQIHAARTGVLLDEADFED